VKEYGAYSARQLLPRLSEQPLSRGSRSVQRIQRKDRLLVAPQGAAQRHLVHELLRLSQEAGVEEEKGERRDGHELDNVRFADAEAVEVAHVDVEEAGERIVAEVQALGIAHQPRHNPHHKLQAVLQALGNERFRARFPYFFRGRAQAFPVLYGH
jgi:predicted lipid-binding transport protein (Tim44 family)